MLLPFNKYLRLSNDLRIAWNFKHIVNVYRIRGYNSINLRLGHGTLEIHSPKEIVYNENEN